MGHAPDAPLTNSSVALPFWARAVGVTVIVGCYFLLHAAIAVSLHSALGVDNAIENYHAQSLALSYSAGNPPLYAWLLYGIQRVTGPGVASFALLNYGSLFACLMLLHRVARRAIGDPRLQAIAVFSYSLVWEIGHESHRILTHSNLMMVAIAATVLTILRLAENGSFFGYLKLGFWIAFGLLSKFAFGAFLLSLSVAVLGVAEYRSVIFNRRAFATLAVAMLPLISLKCAGDSTAPSTLHVIAGMLAPSRDADLMARIGALLRSFFGYVIPLLPVAGVLFFHRTAERHPPAEARNPIRTLLTILSCAGLGLAALWMLGFGNMLMRPRYFHALLLLFPILLFAGLDRAHWPARTLRLLLAVTAIVAIGIAIEQILPRLAPAKTLFGSCRLSIPYDSLGSALQDRFGKTPTLIGLDAARAGQLRAAVPGARLLSLAATRYRPPRRRDAAPCVLVWLDDDASAETIASAHQIDPNSIETWEVAWFQPWLRLRRSSRFHVSLLPGSSQLCE